MNGTMKSTILVLLFSVILMVNCANVPEKDILGGKSATPYEKPFVVSIQVRVAPNYRHVCGGVIIQPRWVLTSGACLDPVGITDVLSGKYDLGIFEERQQRRGTLKRSSSTSTDGLLALVHLATPFTYDNRTQAAYLAGPRNPVTPGEDAILVGWEAVDNPQFLPGIQTLKKATFTVMEPEQCQEALGQQIDSAKEFCTGPVSEEESGVVSACNGNLGSPMYQDRDGIDYVVGILVGYHSPCNVTGMPTGVFARVSNYLRWISGVVEQ